MLAHIPIIFLSYSFIFSFLLLFDPLWSKFHVPGMALATDKVGQKEFYTTLNLYVSLISSLGQMAFNVPAVYEVGGGI
jgi:hypothetical protein